MTRARWRRGVGLPLVLSAASCGSGPLNAGYDIPHGELPVDERSAIVLVNDGARDNWQAEYAALLAASGQLRFVGLVVNTNAEYPSLDTNVAGFRQLIAAARESGIQQVPDPTASVAPELVVPSSGIIDDTVPNRSEGAWLILQAAARWGSPGRPLAIATGGALTDVADALLLDKTLAERAVVVASLGRSQSNGASTGDPNGDRDSWATFIVMTRMRFVQVNGYYDQLVDLPESSVSQLPDNAFGAWMAQKRGDILGVVHACDQVSVLSAALPWFPREVSRMRLDPANPTLLASDPEGPLWHVAQTDSERARAHLWSTLTDPRTFL